MLGVLADLMRGKTHDRHSIADRCGIRPHAADRRLRLLVDLIPGVKEVQNGKIRAIRFEGDGPRFPAVVAACVAASLGRMFEGSAHEQNMRDARTFLLERLRHRRALVEVDRKFLFVIRGGEHAFPEGAGELDEVIDAVLDSRWVAFDYSHFSGQQERKRVRPVSLAIHEHQFYVFALLDDGTVYPFRFSRMRSVEADEVRFEYPPKAEYDPVQILRDSIGIFITTGFEVANVEVKLSKKWEVYALSHRWHSSQKIERQADGVLVKLRARLCPELEMWVLGFGEDAVVVNPPALREKIASRAAGMAAAYGSASKSALAKARKRPQAPAGTVRRAVVQSSVERKSRAKR